MKEGDEGREGRKKPIQSDEHDMVVVTEQLFADGEEEEEEKEKEGAIHNR